MKPKPSGTVRKAFQVLDQLSGSQAELAPREVAQLTGLDRTTVYRLPETLVQIGVVARDPQTARYRLGLRTLDYANAALDALEVRHVALSHLIDLDRELVLEPDGVERGIFVGVLDGPEIVLVEMGWTRSVFSRSRGRMGRSGSALASIGLSAPANSTTVEKLTERVLSQTHRRSPAYGYGAPPPRLTLWISVQ